MPRGGQTDGVESGRSDAARRCRRRLRIFFLLQGLDHRDRSGDAPVVAAVGRRRETHREEGSGPLSLPCIAGRGGSYTYRSPSPLPLGSTFCRRSTSVNQSLPPLPFHHFGSFLCEGGLAAAGPLLTPFLPLGLGSSRCDLGRCRALPAITRRGGERGVRGHLNFK